jgi:hypothetical protein
MKSAVVCAEKPMRNPISIGKTIVRSGLKA